MKVKIGLVVTGLLLTGLKALPQSNPTEPRVTLKATNLPRQKAIDTICKLVHYMCGETSGLSGMERNITVNFEQVPLSQALDECFRNSGLRYIIDGITILIQKEPNEDISHTPIVTVRVANENNEPLIGASINVKGTALSGVTDTEGLFHSRYLRTGDTLLVTFTGFGPAERVVGRNTRMDIMLTSSPAQLDKKIVYGYRTTTQRLNTGNVAMVSAKVFDIQPVTDPLAALEGLVPGLVITQTSGVPGAGFTILIRGQHSLAQGQDPFYVIDGVPYAPNGISLSNLPSGGAPGSLSPFTSIDPENIESIAVLKDADATAIYGSRGANGVILITTRRGSPGKPQFSLNLSSGISVVAATHAGLMGTPAYIRMRLEALHNDGVTPDNNNAPDLLLWDTVRYTDFKRMLTGGIAHTMDGRLSLSGGDKHTRYLVSSGYHSEQTVFPGNVGYRRVSVLGDLIHSSQDNHLQLRFSGMLGTDRNNEYISDLSPYALLAPNAPHLLDATGKLVWQENGVSFTNPLSFTRNSYLATTGNVLVNGNLGYQILRRLMMKVNLGYNRVATAETGMEPIAGQDPSSNPTGSTYTANTAFTSWTAEPQAEFSDTMGKHILQLMAGTTWEGRHNSVTSLSATGFSSDALLGKINAAQRIYVGNNISDYRYEAFFGRLSYAWANTWLLNISGRRDGSSRFGPGRQFGTFGAAGAGWIFSNTAVVKEKLSFLSFGKIRASYGTSGNDQIGDYQYLSAWEATTTQPYQGVPGFYPANLYNPDLSWETIRKLEAGLELGFLKNRILFNGAWYRDRSSNQLIPYLLPLQTSFASIERNFPAVIQNSGIELSLTAKNIQQKKTSWTTSINLSIPRDKLVSFPNLATSPYAKQLEVGQSFHIVKGYRFSGVDPGAGVFHFFDDSNMVVTGKRDITCYGGLQNTFITGPWELDVFIEGRQQTGNNVLTTQYGLNSPGNMGPGQFSNQPAAFINRWQHPGDHAPYQQYSEAASSAASQAIGYYISSGMALANTSFIRLKTVAVTWHFPEALLRKLHLAGGKAYLQGQNLWTLTGYRGADPETQNAQSLPPLRTITTGLQITFK
ncbi:MAG TPA: SusC/RagA family TonB-linked outer membrane protein [Puia sp.]|nr:SusC/RagA family TonB-linked outer membrane protein [Puia sp.]